MRDSCMDLDIVKTLSIFIDDIVANTNVAGRFHEFNL